MAFSTSLIAAYDFEASGANIGKDRFDSNDLSLTGTVPQAAGNSPPGQFSASFTNNSANNLNRAALYDGSTDFTLTCWVYVTAFQSFDLAIANQWQSGATQYQLVLDHTNKDFKAQGSVNGSSAAASPEDGQGAISLNTWYFVEMFYDRTNHLLGINRNNGTAVTASLASIINLAQPFTVGANGVGGGFPMSGRIDALSVWGRLLTGTERGQLYGGGGGLEYPFPTRRRGGTFIFG